MKTETLKIKGMTCEHCVKRVTEGLEALDGMEKVHVDLKEESAQVTFDEGKVTEKMMDEAVKELGYKVKRGLFS